MKILMFGRGIIAVLYGWALEKAGHSVDFYVRPGRAAYYGPSQSLKLLDARAKAKGVPVAEDWPLRLREDLPTDHDYDLIVVSVQHYQFTEATEFLGPRAGRATVLVFGNFWHDPQVAAAALPADQLAWGFPQAGGAVGADGVLTGSLFGKVRFGTFGTTPTAREVAVRELFQQSGFQVAEDRDFRGWLWTHFAINAGLFAQAWRAGSPGRVLASAAQRREAIRTVRELLPVLAARGVDLKARAADVALYQRPPRVGSGLLWLLFKVSPPLRAMVESYTNGEEQARTCRDVLAEARRLGVPVPRLEAAVVFAPESSGG
ncbi:ketopantoate reductase family protein [Hymenobacter sp. PAMC 26628]|uniref:ketopantoate reductase family protein n=1 Tax=Hymenobacter sp. PAMC 26628 TaxID=1484118 RepID=UPI0007703229|nr:2-dehydropantoate 2-reductase N-terminal domain-containing protein [Hymenobacter sp. PAMC 26628]AMJ67793.1 ketopantoate reductase [Hymenobacter sp. PAMC 26628]